MDTWKEFAKLKGGNYIEEKAWNSAKAELDCKGYPLIWDNYTYYVAGGRTSQVYTRAILRYASTDNFKLELNPNSLIPKIAKLFGAQDVETGYPEFDRLFIVKANNALKVRNMLGDSELRELINTTDSFNLQISDQAGIWGEKLPNGILELSYFTEGYIKDMRELERITLILCIVFSKLEEAGSVNKQRL